MGCGGIGFFMFVRGVVWLLYGVYLFRCQTLTRYGGRRAKRRMPPHLVGVGAYHDHNSKGYPHRQGKRDGMQIGAYKNECTDLLGLRVSLPSWWVCKRLLLLGVWPNLVALDSISTNCRLLMQPYGFYSAQLRFFLGAK